MEPTRVAAVAIAESGKEQDRWELDVDGDGVPGIQYVEYNNGRIVSIPLTVAGAEFLGSNVPTVDVDPAWDPDAFDKLLPWNQIFEAVKYGVYGLVGIGVLYVGVTVYQSVKTGKELRFPMAERGGRFFMGGAEAAGRGVKRMAGV